MWSTHVRVQRAAEEVRHEAGDPADRVTAADLTAHLADSDPVAEPLMATASRQTGRVTGTQGPDGAIRAADRSETDRRVAGNIDIRITTDITPFSS